MINEIGKWVNEVHYTFVTGLKLIKNIFFLIYDTFVVQRWHGLREMAKTMSLYKQLQHELLKSPSL